MFKPSTVSVTYAREVFVCLGVSRPGTLGGSGFNRHRGSSEIDGGVALADTGSTLIITNSTINGNNANYGGVAYIDGSSTLTITNSTISGNNAGTVGGAVALLSAGFMEIRSSTFSKNQAQ
ncbi:hypothetical protein CYMTET_34662, partial [Cymbomonas tetramitiformis]